MEKTPRGRWIQVTALFGTPARMRLLAGTLLVAVASGACAGDPASGHADDSASVQLLLTQAPADVQCLRLVATGTRRVVRTAAVSPGITTRLTFAGLPEGSVVLVGEAFPNPCASLEPATPAPWLGGPVAAELRLGLVAMVTMPMRRNGQARVTIAVDDDDVVDAGVSDAASAAADAGFADRLSTSDAMSPVDGPFEDSGPSVAPANDTCAGATILRGSSGSLPGTMVGATTQVSGCGVSDVFYAVIASGPSLIYLDTFTGGTGDTLISSYGPTCGGARLQCADDQCGVAQSQLVQQAPTAGTYYFAVHSYSSRDAGAFTLTYAVVPVASGTNQLLGMVPGHFDGTVPVTGTARGSCGGVGGENALYWMQCPADNRRYHATTCQPSPVPPTAQVDSVLYLRFNGTEAACGDDTAGTTCSTIDSPALTGAGLVQLFVDAYTIGQGGYGLDMTVQ
jgi:hypothetical protein